MAKTEFTKKWIIEHGIPIVESYLGNITIRALHYRLVAAGMINDIAHYKKVVNAMTDARWDGLVEFDAFKDHERETLGETKYRITTVQEEVTDALDSIKFWANYYRKNKWENQPIYPEVFIEKKALQGVFEDICKRWNVALSPCKGYPSLTFLNDAKERFNEAASKGKEVVILYFGDYDCSGEDIPRSIQENLERMGCYVTVKRIALMEHQVKAWKLPPAPTKATDSRGANWEGMGQVELDAVEPKKIVQLCSDAIEKIFNQNLYDELLAQEAEEKEEYNKIIKADLKKLFK